MDTATWSDHYLYLGLGESKVRVPWHTGALQRSLLHHFQAQIESVVAGGIASVEEYFKCKEC